MSKYEVVGAGSKKSSSSSPRTPVEAPNTLRSKTRGKLLDLIGYGPIKGLVDGDKSIFLDKTPLQNPNGSYNFSGINIQYRLGTPEQEVISGFRDVSNPREIGTQLVYGSPTVRTVSNNDADAVVVTVRLNSLVKSNVDNGDTNPTSVPLRIDILDKNGLVVGSTSPTISGKTTSAFERSYRLNLTGEAPFQVRVQRTNKESELSSKQDRVDWSLLTEVVDVRQNYPGCVLFGIDVDAKEFGNSIPDRSYELYLSIVKVPSNYDPYTRTYSGIWDGTFKHEWTDNPAWVYYDLATNPIIGAGLENVNKFALYEIAQYCDELVDDGFGGKEPRFTCNTMITGQEDAITALNTFASVFRGMAYWGAGTVEPVADMPGPIRKIITPSDVMDGEFVYEGTSLKDRNSVYVVSWNDPDNYYESTPEMVEDSESIELFGWREGTITAVACTSRGQARRLGLWALYSERMETQTVSFSTPVKNHDMRPGDYFELQDPYRAGQRLGGKVVSVNGLSVELDDLPEALQVGWSVIFETEEGGLESRTVRGVDAGSRVITLNSPTSAIPAGSFLLHDATVRPQTFRVVSVQESEGDVYGVTAVEHDPRKYDIVEKGLKLPPIPNSLISSGRLKAPTNLSASAYTYPSGNDLNQALTIGWSSNDERADRFMLEAKGPDDVYFVTIYSDDGISYDLKDVKPGLWSFRVKALSAQWADSPWTEASKNTENLLVPKPAESLIFVETSFSIKIIPVSTIPGTDFEFWKSFNRINAFNEIEGQAEYLGTSSVWLDDGLPFNTEFHYYVRAVNRQGKSLWIYGAAQTKADVDEILDAMLGDFQSSDLGEWFKGEIDKISGEGEDSVNERIGLTQEAIDGLGAELDSLEGEFGGISADFSSLQATVDVLNAQLQDITNAPVHEPSATYLVGQIVKGEEGLYRAKQDVPVDTPLSDTVYWEKIGDYDSLGEAVSSLVARTDNLRTDVDEALAQASTVEALQSTVTDLELGVESNSTAISSISTEVDNFRSTTEKVDVIEAQFKSTDDNGYLADVLSTWNNRASIIESREVITSDREAQAVINLQVQSKLESVDGDISGVATVVDSISTRVDATEDELLIQAGTITGIESKLIDLDDDVTANASNISSMVTEIQGLKVSSERTDLISAELKFRADGDDDLLSRVLGAYNHSARIAETRKTIVTDKVAQATEIRRIESSISSLDSKVDTKASITQLNTAKSDLNTAIAQSENRLQSSISSLDSKVDTKASIAQLNTTKSDLNNAIAQSENRLESSINNTNASVSTISSAVTDINGSLSAMGGLKVETNVKGVKYIAGIGVSIAGGPAGVQSEIVMQADKFMILDTVNGTARNVFSIVDGVTVLRDALIGNGTITTAKIADLAVDTLQIAGQAVSIPGSISAEGRVYVSSSSYQEVLRYTFTCTGSPVNVTATASVILDAAENVGIGRRNYRGAIYRHKGGVDTLLQSAVLATFAHRPDGNRINQGMGTSVIMVRDPSPGVGKVSYSMQIMVESEGSSLVPLRVSNRVIMCTETKK